MRPPRSKSLPALCQPTRATQAGDFRSDRSAAQRAVSSLRSTLSSPRKRAPGGGPAGQPTMPRSAMSMPVPVARTFQRHFLTVWTICAPRTLAEASRILRLVAAVETPRGIAFSQIRGQRHGQFHELPNLRRAQPIFVL